MQGLDARRGEPVGPLQPLVQTDGGFAFSPLAGVVLDVSPDVFREVDEGDRFSGPPKAPEEFGDEPIFVEGGSVLIGDADGFPFLLDDAFSSEAPKSAAPLTPVEPGVRLEFFESGRRGLCGPGYEGGFGGGALFCVVGAPVGERYGGDSAFACDFQEVFGEQPFHGPPELAGAESGTFLRARAAQKRGDAATALKIYLEAAEGWDQYAVRARLAVADMALADGGRGALLAAQSTLEGGSEAWRGGRYELEVLRRLRAPGGCPWDQKQTSESLIPYLLEETYEIIEAIEEGDIETLKEELGDLTLHILFQAELARESGTFDISDSLRHISEKLIRRHPQVFDKHNSKHLTDDMNKSWEAAKQKEKQRDNILDGVPKSLPALIRARRIQEKAANVGFDWDELPPVLDKIDEEMTELKEAVALKDPENIKDEMGDVLFSLVNLSRFLDINPEHALRMTISKFETRFSEVEKELKKKGKSLTDSTLEEMDEIWNSVKKKARV